MVVSARPSASPERQRAGEPWNPASVVRVIGASGVGFLAVGVAWYVASETLVLERQLLCLVIGIAGVTVAAVWQGMFVLDGLRHLKRRRTDAMVDLAALLTGPEVVPDGVQRVASEAMTHFHRPGCPFAAGKDLTLRGTADEHLAAGRTACGVCEA